MIRIREL